MSYWEEKVKIGTLEVPRFMGGPLDGITDSPFRKLVRNYSKDELLYGEMRHVGCVANDKGGVKALEFEQFERPLNYQVSANKVEYIEKACEKILAAQVDCIDLNIGCPAKNVVKSGSGSSLMADLPRLKEILTTFRRLIPINFTVKIRAGYKSKNAIEVAQLIQDCGADGIAIHPRLQTQLFSGVPDYEYAALVKKSVEIPVLLSGGIVNFATAKRAYEITGVDGYLIGRGLWSKPWKLHELREHAAGRPFKITDEQILACALEHLDNMMEYYGELGLYAFRKHLAFYIKGKSAASELRGALVREQSLEKVKDGIRSFFEL
ncbi:tRNA-dihydrouridine synthase family protein [Candidatus Babeliales bacterium]|nr:tRNA-dihydrouridine synthase family protein [Candidatus Babeliales bacterium]